MPSSTTPPLIYLDVDDEITSAAARIRGQEAERVALVLPYGSRLATSRINFRLLAREAAERGKAIEIVTADGSARSLAAAAGLPVYPSVAAFEGRGSGGSARGGDAGGHGGAGADATTADGGTGSGSVRAAGAGARNGSKRAAADAAPDADDTSTRVLTVPRRKAERVPFAGRPQPAVRRRVALFVAFVVVLLLAAGAFAAYTILPSATITLAPRSAAVGPLALAVEARPDVTAPDATTLTVPATRFTFQLEARDTFPATGLKVTDTKATGKVTFSNFNNGTGYVIPAGSVVQTQDKIQFVTLAKATLPQARQDFFPPFSTHPSTTTVAVEAVVAGESGNVGANQITELPKGAKNLFVTNEEPTSGGAHTESPQVSQQDVDAAMTALDGTLRSQLDDKVAGAADVPPGTTVIEETATLGDPTPTVDPATLVGTQGATFDLGLSAQGTVLGVNQDAVRSLATQRLQAGTEAGWHLVAEATHVEVGTPTVFGDVVTYRVTVTGQRVRTVDEAQLASAIRGLGIAQARSMLGSYGDVEISLWPDWVTTIPTNPQKINLTLLAPRPEAGS